MAPELLRIIKKLSLEVNRRHKTREVPKRKDVVDLEIKRANLIRKGRKESSYYSELVLLILIQIFGS